MPSRKAELERVATGMGISLVIGFAPASPNRVMLLTFDKELTVKTVIECEPPQDGKHTPTQTTDPTTTHRAQPKAQGIHFNTPGTPTYALSADDEQ